MAKSIKRSQKSKSTGVSFKVMSARGGVIVELYKGDDNRELFILSSECDQLEEISKIPQGEIDQLLEDAA